MIGAVNRSGQVKVVTVGPASPAVELSLADDGEVLCCGDFLMSGIPGDWLPGGQPRTRKTITREKLVPSTW